MTYTGNEICDFCINVIEWWSKNTTFSYGEINVILFIVVQPTLILLFAITTIIASITKSKKLKKYLLVLGIVGIVGLIVGTCVLIGFPVLDAAPQMRAHN